LARAEKVNTAEKSSLLDEHWSPEIVSGLNGQHAGLVKFIGEFVWNHPEEEDALLLIVNGP
jgi:hypothetical protein